MIAALFILVPGGPGKTFTGLLIFTRGSTALLGSLVGIRRGYRAALTGDVIGGMITGLIVAALLLVQGEIAFD